MRTVGEILGQKRKDLGLSLEEVEKETKIRQKYLLAIESDNFGQIPESTIVKGFVRNYAQFLSLSADNILAIFRRDFCENEKGQIIPRGMVEPLDKKRFYWTPKLTVITTIAILLTGFIFFFVRQYLGFSSAPPLQVFSPVDGQTYKEKIEVVGKTDKDASIKIEGNLISIFSDGSFKEEIVLPRGENTVTIEAANRQGRKTLVTRKVKVE